MAARRDVRDVRAALVTHAEALIAERGVWAVSLRDVAKASGVSHAAPAHHFTDKSALLTAVAASAFDRFADHLEERIAAAGDTESSTESSTAGDAEASAEGSAELGAAIDRLAAAGVAYVEFASAHRSVFDFMFERDLLDVADEDYLTASARSFGVLVAAVTEARDEGWAADHDIDDLVALCWANAHGLAALAAAEPTQPTERLIRLQLAGLAALSR